MKIFIIESLNEANISPLQKEYQAYFTAALKDTRISSGWAKGKGKK